MGHGRSLPYPSVAPSDATRDGLSEFEVPCGRGGRPGPSCRPPAPLRAPSVCAPAPCVGATPVNASPVRLRPLPTDLHPHSPHLRTAPCVCARAWIPSLARMRAEGFVL